jgi:hypothetical protein
MLNNMQCLLQTAGTRAGRGWVQEAYETETCDANRRTRQLHQAGFTCSSESIPGTPWTLVSITLIDGGSYEDQTTRFDLPSEGWMHAHDPIGSGSARLVRLMG